MMNLSRLYPSTISSKCLFFFFFFFCLVVERSPVRNIQVFNPTTNTLNVRWEAATGPVQQYKVIYSPVTGVRPPESVSFLTMSERNTRRTVGSQSHSGRGRGSRGSAATMTIPCS